MKKLIALLLGLILLCCAAAAFAGETTSEATAQEEPAELPYMETEPQDVYISDTVLTEASYPQVCISPYGAYSLFSRDNIEPWYVTFPCPEGMRCSGFRVDEADFLMLDANNAFEIYYSATDRYSYEVFLGDCEDENNIILDGSEGVAAYIEPDRSRARALFGLDEIEKTAKLVVTIHLQGMRSMEDAEKAEVLKARILDEIARLQGSMACVKADKFWTDGAYRGVKLYVSSADGNYVMVDLPEIAFNLEDANISGQIFPVSMSRSSFECYVCGEGKQAVEIEFSVDTYSYVYYNRDEAEIQKVTLSDGNEWGIYVANERDGKPYSVHAARVLNTVDSNGEEKPLYLTVQVNASSTGKYWADLDAFVKDLDVIAQGVRTAE